MPIDAELAAWYARLGREFGAMPDASPASRRQRYEEITDLLLKMQPRAHVGIRNFHLALPGRTLDSRLYHPGGTPALLVFFHGGGWVVGSLHSHDQLCAWIAARSGVAVLAVDYRLAPEHPFPAPVDDAYDAVLWAAAHGDELACDIHRLAVGGDSAGGHLAAITALIAREQNGPRLACQWLIYPAIEPVSDPAGATQSSLNEFAAGPGLTADDLRWFWAQLGVDAQTTDQRGAPSRAASHAGLPPAYVLTAELDPIRDEGERYAAQLQAAGVKVTLQRGPGMTHGFARLFPVCRPAGSIMEDAALALQHALQPVLKQAAA